MKLASKFEPYRFYPVVLISLIYAILGFYFFGKYGVKIVVDSPRYLDYAGQLIEGFYFDPLNFWSFSYVIFISIHKFFSDSLLTLIISQYILGYLAVLALYQTSHTFTNSRAVAIFTCLLFLAYPDNILFHSYILTESIYSSFLCFSFYAWTRYAHQKTSSSLVILIFTVAVCFFCKPTSPALILALLAPAVFKFLLDKTYRILKIVAVAVSCFIGIVLANQMISMHEVLDIYKNGDVIFAIHTLPNHPFRELLTIEAPTDLYIPESENAILINMGGFILNNPLFYSKLFASKLFLFITHIRPYWSLGHNIFAILLIWPSYCFGILAIKNKLISKPLLTTVLIYVSIHILIVSNTWADWDARFFVPLFPILAFFAALGLHNKYGHIVKKVKSEE